jgi:TPP-dependent pyruvate/acetoin dehydrogenase alpha subunit
MSINKIYEKLFKSALRIRLVEEKIISLYPSDKIQSPVHLSIGQEAVAVGVCQNLANDDWVFINYRGHAFYLAKGGPLPEFFAELMGKISGLSKGKGGSMHLAAPHVGIMGASAVVASTISHAAGAALASKIRGERRVFVANFGDGATEQGVFHETLNFTALHQLPVLFLCEDNELAVHASKAERQSFDLNALVSAYGIKYHELKEGYDIVKVYEAAKTATETIRESGSPVFLHIRTARYKEHVGPGDDFHAGYRSEADIRVWQKKDPLCQDRELIEKFTPELASEIDRAVEFAENAPLPTEKELLSDVE